METSEAIIEEARKGGWKPKEEWNGDPDQWRSAEEFVERGNSILAIVKERTAKEIAELKKEAETSNKFLKSQLDTIVKQANEKAKKEYDAKLAELKKKELTAVAEGDTEEFERIQTEKENIKPVEIETQQTEQTDPVFESWKKDNAWYENDETATLLAMGYASKLKEKEPEKPYDEFLEAVGSFVRSELPHKFTNANREQVAMVEEEGHTGSNKKGKSFKDLPPGAQATCKKNEAEFKKKGLQFDRDEWVRTYFED